MRDTRLKTRAIELRMQGKTFSEILKEIPVAKSTISFWLKEVGLSVAQKQNITEKRIQAQMRGAQAQKDKRVKKQAESIKNAQAEIGNISKRELWLIGTALYWAEGAKEKVYRPGSQASLSNSDPKLLIVFIKWLRECVGVSSDDIRADLYIHESHRNKVDEVINSWSEILKEPLLFFKHVYFKKNKINTKRKNTGVLYLGVLRVNIRASSDLNRKIQGWIKGICAHCGIV